MDLDVRRQTSVASSVPTPGLDHIGFAERLRREHGVPVSVHSADAQRVRGGNKAQSDHGPARLRPVTGFLLDSLGKCGWRSNYSSEVTEVADGDVLPLPGAPRVIGMPGHSPGSIAVHVPAASAAFVGDALTTRHVLTGHSGLQPAPFTDDPDWPWNHWVRCLASTPGGCCPGTAPRGAGIRRRCRSRCGIPGATVPEG